jgi:hypothetical protein
MLSWYLLGAIPPLSVLKGETLDLVVESKLGKGATFSLSFEGAKPKGAMSLDSGTGALRFTPAPQDRVPIKAVLQAKKDGKSEQQTVAITPLVPSDFNLIEHRSSDGAAPDPAGWQYVTFVEEAAEIEKEGFNNEVEHEKGKEPAVQTKQVIVSGVRLVLERTDKYPLFARMDGSKSYKGRTDLKRVTLCADEVVVRSRLELPGTDLTIYARKLIFEAEGQIVTTPRFVTLEAKKRMEGHRGQGAGSVVLYVGELETSGDTVRIITTGGQGQAAKPGVGGDKGSNRGTWDGHFETPTHLGFGGTYGLDWPKDKEGYKPVYVEVGYYVARTARSGIKTRSWMASDDKFGHKIWPGDGTDPKDKPGAPGQGGNGGSIHSAFSSQLGKKTELKAGDAGKKANDIPAAKAGEPQQACWARAVYEWDGWLTNKLIGYEFIDKHTSHHGAEAKAPGPVPQEAPKTGELKSFDRPNAGYWLHPNIVRALLQYAHDSMLAGRPEDARNRLAPYDLAVTEARKSGGALSDAGKSSVEWPALGAGVSALIQRIDSPNDYFGNPAGWVPMLSFEANLRLYEEQIGEAIKTMYLAYWIETNQQKSQKAKGTFEKALTSLAKESQQAEKDSVDALKRLGELETKCSEIATAINGLQATREYRMAELKKDAANQLRFEKLLRSSGEVLGAILQLAPVAQPALGAFGKGLTVLSEFDPEHPGKTFSGVAGAFSDLAKEKLTEKLKPLFESIKAAKTEQEDEEKKPSEEEKDPEKAKEKEKIKKGVAKKKLAEKVAKVLDDEKEAKEQLLEAFSNFSASEDELKERLEELEAKCPEYKELIKEIKKLNDEKAGFMAELMATLEILDQAAVVLIANQQARIELRSQLDATLDKLNPEALQYIQGMGQRARQRLLKYQYYLLKSYQYLMFEDFAEIDFRAQKIVDEFARILGGDGTLSDTQYEKLRGIFDAQLQDIVEKIIDGYQGNGFGRENEFQVQLTKSQLQVLNEKKELTLDPMQMASLDLQRDKMRLMAIATETVELSGLPHKNVSVSLTYEHDGISRLRAGGRLYLFRSGVSSKTAIRQRMFWETIVNYDSGAKAGEQLKWKESAVDRAAESLLEFLINKVAKNDSKKKSNTETLLSYRPSPWAKITIRCQEANFNYKIDKLVLKFFFVANLVDDKMTTVLVRMGRGTERVIHCDAYDVNRRSDGAGTFLRTFRRGTKITLEAPDEDFEGWEIGKQPKPKGPLELKLDNPAYIVKANFRRVVGLEDAVEGL